nr:4'-phosphopantetheinyl transferase superfamily protein [uncultured Methylophaga sp.]
MNASKVTIFIDDISNYTDQLEQESYLSEQEKHRAERFVSNAARKEFILAHYLKRKLLAERLGVLPQQLEFKNAASGKPYLYDNNIFFNISHSNGAVALAIADVECSIDIEKVRPLTNLELLIEKTMSPSEKIALNGSQDRNSDFLNKWVIKEAFLKLSGAGLSVELNTICTESEVKRIHDHSCILRNASLSTFSHSNYIVAASSLSQNCEFQMY